jgi:uncharacterized protein YkwD
MTGTPQPVEPARFVLELERGVGRHRVSHGLSKIRRDPILRAAALLHAERMRDKDFFDHVDPHDHSSVMDRVMRVGSRRWTLIAENIAAGQWTPEQVLQGWLDSPGHRANLERANLTSGGTAIVSGGRHRTYIVQVYGIFM